MPVLGQSHFFGGRMEFGTFTLDPANVAAASQGIETVTISGAKVGDLVFINCEALDNRIAVVGAKITATDTLSVYINNMYDATTGVNGAAKTYSYMLVHLT